MRCPYCDKKMPGITCDKCDTVSPENAKYCIECGAIFHNKTEASPENEDYEDFDFEDRVLCSDGTCTGILVDGKCSECGKSHADIN